MWSTPGSKELNICGRWDLNTHPNCFIRVLLWYCGRNAQPGVFHLVFVLVGLAYEIVFIVQHYFYVGLPRRADYGW